ncbi:hypothetical protein [Cellulosilyticum sp. I15G10I2]|uniref:hypothetical protein n=1 Tax=Cellulosilyticum sp. I15G10I2 TaxID=1892843 RepID=UPI00085BF60A|nr:hypothetical protein [Cellulosilyticum sp. I15G10I2]
MSTLLTKQQLENHLLQFRHVLSSFDYSSIQNIRFLNLESFFVYMDNVENNPFKQQYDELQKILDAIQPYLPFVSSKRAKDFLNALGSSSDDEEVDTIKRNYTEKLRQDFINLARTITIEDEWQRIIDICEEIRLRKEEMLLALH